MTAPLGNQLGGATLVDAVVRALGSAGDEQLARVVAFLDALPARGDADAVIAPLRQRLAALRPIRPLNVTRLLFTPLDPVIVAAGRWRRNTLTVPRSALAPMAEAVRRAIGPTMDAVAAALEGVRGEDTEQMGRLGSVLWPAAAHALSATLARGAAPPGWHDDTGIAVSEYRQIATGACAVLAEAVRIWQLQHARLRDDAPVLRAILVGGLGHGPHGLGCVLRVLLACHPNAARVLSVAMHAGIAADPAVDAMLDDGLPGTDDREVAPAKLARVAAVLNAAEAACMHSDRREDFARMRRRADSAQQERFAIVLRDDLVGPAQRLGPVVSDAEAATLEEAARHLRRMEVAGRALGGGDGYDTRLRDGADAVSRLSNLPLIDRVRLVEILAGPDQAEVLLRTGGPA